MYTLTETDMIAREVAKENAIWHYHLSAVEHTGQTTNDAIDIMCAARWIDFGGPRPEILNPYNCFRLTTLGREELEKMEAEDC